jgi:antitoxin component YwqK of YwqJK toxin-antitoxin module
MGDQNVKFWVDSFYNDTLIRKRVYEEWGMSAEIFYDKVGNIASAIAAYQNGFKQWVQYLDYNTGHMAEAGWYKNGNPRYYKEFAEDSFDAPYRSYYENGIIAEEGFYRKEPINWVTAYTDTSFTVSKDTLYEWRKETQVGAWHYYYPNGKDSATGSYAYVTYQFDSVIPYSPGDLVTATLITNFTDIKTGTWSYFSPEGKLICTEEWNKGNLLGRKEIH